MLSEASFHNMTIGRIPSVEGGIQPTIVDAKGDLIAATAADTVNRLAVGSNDQVLVADSSASTGLAWKSYGSQLSSSNPVLNGAFDIWQRGTSFTVTADQYTADRWVTDYSTSSLTISRQTTSDTTNLPSIQYALRFQRNSGQTGTNGTYIAQALETTNSIPYAGNTVTLSFYARKGSNYSQGASQLEAYIQTGTGTDQSPLAFWTNQGTAIGATPTLTTTWQRFSYTGTIASTVTQLKIIFGYAPTGTAGANDYFEITGVQIDVGSVAQPFRRNSVTIQGELAACQRYYFRTGPSAQAYAPVAIGFASSTTNIMGYVKYPITMRTTPTAIEFSTLQANDSAVGTAVSAVAFSGGEYGPDAAILNFTTSGMTQYRPTKIIVSNSTTGYLALTAEL
jgi:hypothetical protein